MTSIFQTQVTKLTPRYYTISSSSAKDATTLHLTVKARFGSALRSHALAPSARPRARRATPFRAKVCLRA
eukprot:6184951-Pleurochrysis_carterae.AAC.4